MGVALLKEMGHCGCLALDPDPSSLEASMLLVPSEEHIELLAPLRPCSYLEDNGLNEPLNL